MTEANSSTSDDTPSKPVPPEQIHLIAVAPRAPTFAQGIYNDLSNLGQSIRLHRMALVAEPSEDESDLPQPDQFLRQFRGTIQAAYAAVERLGAALALHKRADLGIDIRMRARVLLGDLDNWWFVQAARRSNDKPLKLSDPAVNAVQELKKVGEQMALLWIDQQNAYGWAEPASGAGDENVDAVLEQIPPLSSTAEWLSGKQASGLTGLSMPTLRNHRHNGLKSKDGLSGIDSQGRSWRKPPPNGQARYLASSVKRKK